MTKILIVEDDVKTRVMIRRHLQRAGYEIFEACGGEAGLRMVSQHQPDLVLLDIMMPDLTGIQVCKKLRADPRFDSVYIIMLTALGGGENKAAAFDSGADDYLMKPFETLELLARIRVGLKAARQKRDASVDMITNLYNRNFFDAFLEQEVARSHRYRASFSIIMADVDNFKQVNDRHGHLAGDMVLTHLGKLFTKSLRRSDVAARWGGDEFVLLLPQTSLEDAARLARQLNVAVAGHCFGTVGQLTMSFGVAQLEENQSSQDLIKSVDSALLESKSSGKNMVCVRDPHKVQPPESLVSGND